MKRCSIALVLACAALTVIAALATRLAPRRPGAGAMVPAPRSGDVLFELGCIF
jgi:hypothetical protein